MKQIWHRKIGHGVIDVALAAKKEFVVAGDVDGSVRGFDYSGNLLLEEQVSLPVWAIDVSTAGNVAVGMASKTPAAGGVVILDASLERHEWNCGSAVWDVRFSNDESEVFASTWRDGLVCLTKRGTLRRSWKSNVQLFGLSRRANGEIIVTGSGRGVGRVGGTKSEIEWLTEQAGDACYKNLVLPGRILFGSSSNVLYDFHESNGEVREAATSLDQICGMALYRRFVITGDLKGRLSIADKDNLSLPLHLEKIAGGVWSIAVDEPKGLIFVASGEGSLLCYKMDEYAFHLDADIATNQGLLLASIAGAKVFLSYASEDRNRVKDLYEMLRNAGVRPWMDCYDLLPGQNWKREINREMKASDFVVMCLSKRSVQKTGFVQRELREAVELLLNMPDENIFLLPILLDDCELPEVLQDRHYVSLADGDGIPKLLKAISVENRRRAAMRSGQ